MKIPDKETEKPAVAVNAGTSRVLTCVSNAPPPSVSVSQELACITGRTY